MEILAATFRLIFSANPNGPVGTEYPVLVFAVACGFMGGVIVLLDWVTVLAGRESVLKLVYRGPNILVLLLIWGAGAGLAGFLGGAFGIFELGRSASIAVGVAWPLVLPRLLRSASVDDTEHEDFQGEGK